MPITKKKNKNKKRKQKFPYPVIAILLILVIAAAVFAKFIHTDSTSTQTTPVQPQNVNLAPATKEDKQRVSDNKQALVDSQSNQTQTSPGTKKSVTPYITYAGQYGDDIEVGASVSDIFENGGTCTATFSQGSATLSKSVTGVENVSSVACPTMSVSTSSFSKKGAWSVKVTYDSSAAHGDSSPQQIEIK